jgi:large subunit ribosomal protein L25
MTMNISAESRSGLGKEAAKKVRNAGLIPAVYYGFGAESQPVSLNPKSLEQALANPKGVNGYFTLNLDGNDTPNRVLVREIQRHPVTRKILHVDLVCPDPSSPINAVVPLKFIGRSVGVATGGRARRPYREVTVRGLPEQVPSEIVVDITPIEQGQQITASQLDAGETQVVFDRDFVIFKVAAPRGGNKNK